MGPDAKIKLFLYYTLLQYNTFSYFQLLFIVDKIFLIWRLTLIWKSKFYQRTYLNQIINGNNNNLFPDGASIKSISENVIVNPGENATLSCTVEGRWNFCMVKASYFWWYIWFWICDLFSTYFKNAKSGPLAFLVKTLLVKWSKPGQTYVIYLQVQNNLENRK